MQRVSSADGVQLAVYETETGPADAPVIVAVHGYPDNHAVWDGILPLLAGGHRVITYDVRGAGASDAPDGRRGYRLERLTADLHAVLDTVSPEQPVHLVGHDWGSVQGWAAVTDPAFAARIASFTSISGPSLDHAAAWLRALPQHPQAAVKQLVASYYIAVFQLQRLPELLWRKGILDRAVPRSERRTEADKINGLELYRANAGHLLRPRPASTEVPVQVIAPTHDRFVSVAMQTEAPAAYARNLTTQTVEGGHWVIADHPERVAPLIAAHVRATQVG
jgi:pimeloyl-ACP methyl ester carboxylesterase